MSLTHIDEQGKASMVDVSEKPATVREARAFARVIMQPETLAQIQANSLKKGDVLAVARIAGIQAAKKCADLISTFLAVLTYLRPVFGGLCEDLEKRALFLP